MYKSLDQRYKQLMVSKLHGSTSTLLGEVNHREAFIEGSAMGFDTFDKLKEMLSESVEEGKISSATANKLSQVIESFRHMSRTQRSAVVTLLERDVASH